MVTIENSTVAVDVNALNLPHPSITDVNSHFRWLISPDHRVAPTPHTSEGGGRRRTAVTALPIPKDLVDIVKTNPVYVKQIWSLRQDLGYKSLKRLVTCIKEIPYANQVTWRIVSSCRRFEDTASGRRELKSEKSAHGMSGAFDISSKELKNKWTSAQKIEFARQLAEKMREHNYAYDQIIAEKTHLHFGYVNSRLCDLIARVGAGTPCSSALFWLRGQVQYCTYNGALHDANVDGYKLHDLGRAQPQGITLTSIFTDADVKKVQDLFNQQIEDGLLLI